MGLQRKIKIVVVVSELCPNILNRIGSFIEEWGNLEEV
jgi:hypothetical protein